MDQRSSMRPQVPQRPAAAPVEEMTARSFRPQQTEGPRRQRMSWKVVVTVVVVAALVVAGLVWFMFAPKSPAVKLPATDRYQAVFLNNGQVFFGKLKNIQGDYLVLEGAYYTKKAEVPENATAEQKAAVEANVSLAKVGNEVYGPETTMSIRAEQVLFWQNLKSDSKVAKAIKGAEN